MATSAHRTVRKQRKKSGSKDVTPDAENLLELPAEVQAVTPNNRGGYEVRFKPDPFRDLAEKVSFEQLFDEAVGRAATGVPPNYFLWSFLKSEIIPKLRAKLLDKQRVEDFESEFLGAFYRHIDANLAPEIAIAASSRYKRREKIDILGDGELIKVDSPSYRIRHKVSAREHFGYDFFILKVQKAKYGRVTKGELAKLAARIPTLRGSKDKEPTKAPLTTVMYRALVCLATKVNKHEWISQLVKKPEFKGYKPNPASDEIETARDELSKFEMRIVDDLLNRRGFLVSKK